MKRQPQQMVDVFKTKYENVLASITSTLTQESVRGKDISHQSVTQNIQTTLNISFENATNNLKRREIVTRHQTQAIEQVNVLLVSNDLFETLTFRQDKKEAIQCFYALLIKLVLSYVDKHEVTKQISGVKSGRKYSDTLNQINVIVRQQLRFIGDKTK